MELFSQFTDLVGITSNSSSSSRKVLAVELPPVQVHQIEINPDKRARRLKYLLKLNHAIHSITYHNLQFHNHCPHVLGSAYLLGASVDQLNAVYEAEHAQLEPWVDSPCEVSRHDWRSYLGDAHYQRAYVDFFEDQMVLQKYNWKRVLSEYLFSGHEPLINCVVSGLGHPLIHLGYCYEFDSKEVAMEALAMTATSYGDLHKYLDDPSYTFPSPLPTSTSTLSLLQKLHSDTRFSTLFDTAGAENIPVLLSSPTTESLLLEYWNAWALGDVTTQFRETQETAAALLVASSRENNKNGAYDFFLVHTLTTSHALRVLLPLLPRLYHISLLRQWWLLTLSVYIAQLRPAIDVEVVESYDLKGRDWSFATNRAVDAEVEWSRDAHFVKAVRAMKVVAEAWPDKEQFFLKAATKFAEEFDGWGGFGNAGPQH